MKKIIFLAFIAIFLSFTPLFSQETSWDYPIRPGSREWATLPTTADRVKAIQVPEDVLPKLSDQQLLDLILNYPFFNSYILSDNPFDGYQRTMVTLNAYGELKSRPESLNIIFDHYNRMDFSQINKLGESAEIGRFALRVSAIELMLTDFSLDKTLSLEESEKILEGVSRKYTEKSVNEEELLGLGKLTTAFLAANVFNGQPTLKNKIYKKNELENFVANIRVISNDFVDNIINQINYPQNR
ncbi:hypothetical protein Q4534_18570 [Cyclobacterium sp. 1_MG-2023]|uniref:hypothetical protein n=1 Tax=Cyclobacterium sp. 1_MG-2023 TaxID=3062681 RepID=UPI0026E2F655|nr:hypothetical protein [Cyclobacterium sp. 1_MG-2023]MDO6439436.1 hypothetical protein [Cyclobacterium sp. 1_MG-2023]